MKANSPKRKIFDAVDMLTEESSAHEPDGVQVLPLNKIKAFHDHPFHLYEGERLQDMVESIKEHGVLTPVIVQKKRDGYEMLSGHNRANAAKLAGLTEIPCTVFSGDDLTRAQISLVENIQRKDLDPVEEAEGLRDLMERFGLTQEECSAKTGRSRPAIANAVRLLDLPSEVLEMVSGGKLSSGHARALLGLKEPAAVVPLARKAADTGMSVREVEKAVKLLNRPDKPQKTIKKDVQTEVYFAELERKSMELTGHRLKIMDGGEGKRRIVIDYMDNDDLEELLLKLCGPEVLGL